MVRSIIIFGLLLMVGIFAVKANEDDRISCEPRTGPVKNKRYWISKYNITLVGIQNSWRFVAKVYKKANEIMTTSDAPQTPFEKTWGITTRHRYVEYMWLASTDVTLSFFQPRFTVMFHFYHGDTAIVHTIDSKTGAIRSTELGFHTRRLFMVIKPGNWIGVEYPQHLSAAYVFVGVTLLNNGMPLNMPYATLEEMEKKYPMHKEIIRRVV